MLRNLWHQVLMDAVQDPEGGGGGGGGFDAAAFEKSLLDKVSKTMATVVNAGLTKFKTDHKIGDPPVVDPPVVDPPPGDHKADPAVAALKKQLEQLNAKLEASDKARIETDTRAKAEKLSGSLRTELLKHVPADRIESALRIFGPDVKWSEDGVIVGGATELPLEEFIGGEIAKHEYLLPPKQVGGAGAQSGARRGQPVPTLEDIKPGMKPEEMARVREHIANLAREAR